jgi:1-acyl-sn-glycerol-3-phosphate acyltransferase
VGSDGDRLLAQTFRARVIRGVFLNGGLRPIIWHYVHPKIYGLENLEELRPPFLLAPNHSSHMDTPLVLMSLPTELRRRTLVAAASDYFFASRLLGDFVSVAMGAVPIDRVASSGNTMDQVNRLLADGWCLLIYPEGSRTPDGHLYKSKTGIARLALATGVPVVPVGIVGTYHAMPGGRSWPVRGHVEVRFGEALTFERYRQQGNPTQLVLRAIADQIMYDIMKLTELTYVDEYVTKAKARARRQAAAPAASRPPAEASASPAEASASPAEASASPAEASASPAEASASPAEDGPPAPDDAARAAGPDSAARDESPA